MLALVGEIVRQLVLIGPLGLLIAGLVLVVIALATGFLVPGKDRDEWKQLAKSQSAELTRIGDILEDRIRRRR